MVYAIPNMFSICTNKSVAEGFGPVNLESDIVGLPLLPVFVPLDVLSGFMVVPFVLFVPFALPTGKVVLFR